VNVVSESKWKRRTKILTGCISKIKLLIGKMLRIQIYVNVGFNRSRTNWKESWIRVLHEKLRGNIIVCEIELIRVLDIVMEV